VETVGQVIRATNLRDGYTAICKAVAEHGEVVAPRGQRTREFQSATIIVEDPYDTMPVHVGRGFVPGIAAVESAQLLGGVSTAELTIAISPTFAHFTEDNGYFHGAYGPRSRGQFAAVVDKLKRDPESRQVVATIWDQGSDLPTDPKVWAQPPKKDYPCTLLYHFMIRKDKLIMETVMRSNDVYLGLAYDGFQHSRVQIAVASCLGIEPGEYRHHAMSLHVYERDLDKIDKLTKAQRKPEYLPAITGSSWDEIASKAHQVIDAANLCRFGGTRYTFTDPDLQWYASSMMDAIQKNRKSDA
jgi:thymidylate synthase